MCSQLIEQHAPDLDCLFEMIKPVGPYPPSRGFHQQVRIVVPVGKESIERQPNALALLRYLRIANRNGLLSQ